MTKVVLVEAHPLIRLGLHQLLGGMHAGWDVLALDMSSIVEFSYLECDVELAVLGVPDDADVTIQIVADVERILRPRRILLLSDCASRWSPPPGMPRSRVYGCISRTAAVEVIETAVRMGIVFDERWAARSDTHVNPTAPDGFNDVPRAASSHMPATVSPSARRGYLTAPEAAAAPSQASGVAPLEAQAAAALPRQSMDVATGAQLLNVTPRQYEVLTLLARGYPIKTVSRMLNISTATAKAHASTLYQRLRVKSKGEAVYAARQRGVSFD